MNETIAFIGTGVMGESMASNLLAAGNKLRIFSRTRTKAEKLENAGATWCNSPAEAMAEANFAISMVGYPNDVEEVYLGKHGLLKTVRPGSILIDMTTSSPSLAQTIEAACLQKDCHALDAPVSGGDLGAKKASLSIMAGGDEACFEKAKPLLEIMGKTIVLQGPAGAGQFTKMANQIAIASGMVGVCEAIAYAKKSGLSPERVLQSIEHGAAGSWSLSNLIPRALREDWSPGFFVRHFIKDMGIALDSAAEMDLELPGLTLAKKLYDSLAIDGKAHLGTQALLQYYDK